MPNAETNKENSKESGIHLKIPALVSFFRHKALNRPKLKWLILGFVLLIGVILAADYLRYVIYPRPLIGQVLDQNGYPIDGAIVVANKKAAVTRPEGTFLIQAKKNDVLTVSAHGYETATITAANPVATLSPLPPSVARVVVLGPDFRPAAKALVVRLDPNTQAPTAALITDAQGAAVFTRVPDGQAAFIALHPDFGMGWAETAIEASGFARPIIQLENLKVDKRQGRRLVPRAFAQESQDVELRNQLNYKFTDVRNVGKNLFEITEKTRTMVAVSLDPDKLRTFIGRMEEQAQSKLPNAETAQRLQSLLAQEGYDFPVQAKRIIPRWADTTYEVDKGVIYKYDPVTGTPKMTADSVDKVQNNVYLVEIQPASTARTMAFLQRDYAARVADSKPVTVTNWSHIPIAEVAAAMDGGGTVYFDDPRRTVCCRGRSQIDTRGKSTVDDISSAISSTDVSASSINRASKSDTSPSVIFDPLDNSVKIDLSNLSQIKAQNQGLEFSQGGKTVSILDIEPPYPDDAPPEFIKGFFNSSGDALGDYLATPDKYKTAWQNYLHVSTSNARKNANITPSQLFNQLSSQIGANKNYRMTLPGFAEDTPADVRSNPAAGAGQTNTVDADDTNEIPPPNSGAPVDTEEETGADQSNIPPTAGAGIKQPQKTYGPGYSTSGTGSR